MRQPKTIVILLNSVVYLKIIFVGLTEPHTVRSLTYAKVYSVRKLHMPDVTLNIIFLIIYQLIIQLLADKKPAVRVRT